MTDGTNRQLDWEALLAGVPKGKQIIEYSAKRNIFRQGQPADSLFYLRRGKVKLSVISKTGKEAIVAVLGSGDFFGEGCLAGQPLRMATATTATNCGLIRIERQLMTRLLHQRHDVSEVFVAHLLSRNIRYEADLVDHLFNSSEKRLARMLLLLSNFGKESRAEPVLPRVSQEDLAQMVGTTRSRVSHFMNKFRKLGFIDYSESGGLTVHSGILSVVLHDWYPWLVAVGYSWMTRLLHDRHDISEWFVEHLLSHNIRYEADLVDLLFNSAEKRLARALLVLSRFGEASRTEAVVPHLSQAGLAEMVGTSRSRVSRLMRRFRASGFIDHAEGGGLRVHGGLLNVVLHD